MRLKPFKPTHLLRVKRKLQCAGAWGKWRFETVLGTGGKTGPDMVLAQQIASSGTLVKSPVFFFCKMTEVR